MAPQRHIGGEAQHPIHPVAAAPIEDLRAGVMAVRAQQDLDLGPMGADRADEAAQKGADLPPGRLPGRNNAVTNRPSPVKDDNRLEAVIVVKGVEQAPRPTQPGLCRTVIATRRGR
jgi:hypothetical protein